MGIGYNIIVGIEDLDRIISGIRDSGAKICWGKGLGGGGGARSQGW